MENKNYKIKKTGTEKSYGGATRCSKEGKGRFDLIPEDVLSECFKSYSNQSYSMFPEERAVECAINDDYVNAITYITQSKYHKCDEKSTWLMDFTKMVRDLAIHFQKGAEMYGYRNCEKGIPLWSFRDSGIRHLIQYINGETDEPHYISAIWNFVMAEWTIIHHPERCDKAGLSLNNNDDKKVEDCDNSTTTETSNKSSSRDFVDHVCYGLKHVDELMNNIKNDNGVENTLSLMHNLFVTSLLMFVPISVKAVNNKQDECRCITTKISLPKEALSKDLKNDNHDKCISLTIKSTITDGMYVINITDYIKLESIDISLHCVDGTLFTDCRKHYVDENSNTILDRFYNKFLKHGSSLNEEYCE